MSRALRESTVPHEYTLKVRELFDVLSDRLFHGLPFEGANICVYQDDKIQALGGAGIFDGDLTRSCFDAITGVPLLAPKQRLGMSPSAEVPMRNPIERIPSDRWQAQRPLWVAKEFLCPVYADSALAQALQTENTTHLVNRVLPEAFDAAFQFSYSPIIEAGDLLYTRTNGLVREQGSNGKAMWLYDITDVPKAVDQGLLQPIMDGYRGGAPRRIWSFPFGTNGSTPMLRGLITLNNPEPGVFEDQRLADIVLAHASIKCQEVMACVEDVCYREGGAIRFEDEVPLGEGRSQSLDSAEALIGCLESNDPREVLANIQNLHLHSDHPLKVIESRLKMLFSDELQTISSLTDMLGSEKRRFQSVIRSMAVILGILAAEALFVWIRR